MKIRKIKSKVTCRALLIQIFCNITILSLSQTQKTTHNPPVNDFVISGLCFGSITSFSNTTTSTTDLTYTWTISEQNKSTPVFTSNQKDISFLFPNKTTYTVELTAYNGHYSAIQRVIKMDSILKAAFEFYGCQLHFINLSTCAISYLWDFGDGKTSTENSPFHDYASSGNYTAKLIAYSDTKKDSVSVSFPYYANKLTGNFSHKIIGDTVYFKIADTLFVELNTDYYWSWGDGTLTSVWSYPGQEQKHVYPKIGKDSTYIVFLLERTVCFDGFGQGTVTINDNTPIFGTKVFPNPIYDLGIIHIVTDRKKELRTLSIRNMLGGTVTDYQIIDRSEGIDIDLTDLPNGVYFLKFYLGDDLISKKIIKI